MLISFVSLLSDTELLFTRTFEHFMDKRLIESYVRALVVVLYQSDLNLSKIPKQLRVSRCCVRNAVIKFEEYAKLNNIKRSGQPKNLSDHNVRELERLVQGDNRLSASKNNNRLEHESIQA